MAIDLTRRAFVKSAAVGMSVLLLPRAARRAAAGGTPPTLVALFLRGGMDALNVVVPTGDPVYYASRPAIQVPRGSELPLDGFYGLNPYFADLLPLFQNGSLAFIHACGSPDPTRSHFVSQSYMERAAPGDKTVKDGWLNRYLALAGRDRAVAGITLKTAKVRALIGRAPSIAFPRIDAFQLTGSFVAERSAALIERYKDRAATLMGSTAIAAVEALDLLASVPTATSVTYPMGPLGQAFADAAALIKSDIGTSVIAIDSGGWDHHFDEVGAMRRSGMELSAVLKAFQADLGGHASTTLTLAMTEFGRRVAENGTKGTDHGHGSLMLALGGGIAGGRVLTRGGQWPGLAPERLWLGEDLAATTDFRDVFAEVLHRRLGLSLESCRAVLPGFTPDLARFPGLYV